MLLCVPAQVRGEITTAVMIAASHCNIIRRPKMESVCLMTASCISENNSRARRLGGPECSNIRGVTESEIVFIGRGDIAMLLQAAAENVAVMQGGLMSRGQRDHGIFRRVFSGMTAAGGDAAAEKQFALGAVEN